MSDNVYLSTDDLNKLFQQLTLSLTGIDDPTYRQIRVSWPTQGQPAWNNSDDMLFIRCVEVDDGYNRQRVVKVSAIAHDRQNVLQTTIYTRVLGVTWIIYGPKSRKNVNAIRDHILDGIARGTLAAANLYPNPSMRAPSRVPELYNGLWYEREDFTLYFNEKVVINLTIPAITNVPITVIDGRTGETGATLNVT